MPLSAGARLGPYEILTLIGAGGMGEVYQSRDTRLGRLVALKVVSSDRLTDTRGRHRFVQEARAVSALNHPNIVQLYDFSQDAGTDFLVLEYVRGKTLKDLIPETGLPLADVLRYGSQIAGALAAAHSVGIVHRDIKPANIMITPESQVKILDFGVAKLASVAVANAATGDTALMEYTAPGLLVGTTAYMSPEQILGEPVDGRADIFSLGSLLYEAATGRLPFPGPNMVSMMREIATIDPPAPSSLVPDLPAEFDRIIQRALAKEKDQRYASASDLAEALDALRGARHNGSTSVVSPRDQNTSLEMGLGISRLAAQPGQRATRAAVDALRHCCCPWGLKASGRRHGHHQIWARDSMIALLGARFSDDERIQSALRASIGILKEHQSPTGAIPNNVDCETQRPNFRAYADGGLWWIIGSSLLAPDLEEAAKILHWYECQDVDQSGLLSMHEASDWHDLFCTRGKGLYVNCLYVLALRAVAKQLATSDRVRSERYTERADAAVRKLNALFWYHGDGELLPHLAHTFSTENRKDQDAIGRKRWLPVKKHLAEDRYYLPYLGFRAVGEWFDSLGNLLAILAGIADEEQTATILDFIARHGSDRPPLFSLYPVVEPGDPDWRDYYGTRNLPQHYHNGGIWPFIGGFYVAALVKAGRMDAAAQALEKLTDLNLSGEFNEWYHGETVEPMGVQDQAWSAGMQLFATECVNRGHVPIH
jgi:serine/threonine protein kinase